MNRTTRIACIGATALLGALALAQTGSAPPAAGNGQQQQQQRRGPPPEALAACSSASSGASCSFTSPRGNETGTCWAPQAGMPLACRPAGMGAGPAGGMQHKPPGGGQAPQR